MTRARVCPGCGPRLHPVLSELRGPRDVTAAEWLWSPAAGADGHVLVGRDAVVAHPGAGPVVVRARPTALPLASRSVAALVVPPLLADLADVDGLFAELRRVLRPHGLLTLLVPAGPSFGVRGGRLRSAVRARWAHRSAVDHPEWLVTAADFAVLGDDRLRFRAPVHDAGGHVQRLRAAGLLPAGLPAGLRDRVAAHPGLRSGRITLRRIVARR